MLVTTTTLRELALVQVALMTVGGVLVAMWLVHIVRREHDHVIRRILVLAIGAKIAGTLVRHFVLEDVYGGRGDAVRYLNAGRLLAAQMRDGNWPEQASQTGTPFMEFLAGLLFLVTPSTLLAGFIVFSFLGFVGTYLFLQGFRLAVPDGDHRRYAALVLLLPTMFFWPSSLGKEAWLVFTLGVASYGAARVLRRARFGYLIVAAGTAGIWAVRPHMAALFALSFGAAYVLRFRDPEVRRGAVAWAIGLVVVGIGAGYVATNFGDLVPRDESLVDATATEQIFAETYRRTTTGGSEFDSRPVEGPADFLHALVTVPFRPFPTEAHNRQAQIASLEGLLLLVIVLVSLPRIAAALAQVLRRPYVAMSTAYSIGFIIAFSHVGNFGLLTRQRAQLLPLFLVLAALHPHARWRRQRRQRPEAPPLVLTPAAGPTGERRQQA